jgi:hypothetical protein
MKCRRWHAALSPRFRCRMAAHQSVYAPGSARENRESQSPVIHLLSGRPRQGSSVTGNIDVFDARSVRFIKSLRVRLE